MKTHRSRIWPNLAGALAIAVITLAASPTKMVAQQTTQPPGAAVPTVVQFNGVLRDENGKPLSGMVGVTFLLYKEQQGGAPLWLETQNVQPDKAGRYSVMLGSTSNNGLPSDIFIAGEARWLGVQPEEQAEQPRVMLLSVPYALKAGDAETLGGLPVSAFALASSKAGGATSGVTNGSASSGSPISAPSSSSNVTTTGGTVSAVPLWTTATNIQSSALTQTGTGSTAKIGINTNTPSATLDVKGSTNVTGNISATGTVNSATGFNLGGSSFAFGSPSNQNVFLGFSAGNSKTTGKYNIASGPFALSSNTTGAANTASGNRSLIANTSGGYNTAHGAWALQNNTTGSSNTAIGDIALSANTTGNGNVAVGTVAGGASPNNVLTTGNLDTYLGAYTSSGTQTNLTNATAIGAYAEVTENNAMVLGSINGVNGATSSVNVGIGTTAPAATLDVHGTGNFTGLVTFTPSQTFPGAGTITAVNPGAGLLGGGNSGPVKLSVDTSKVVTGVSAGAGLIGGGTGGIPTLSVDPTQVPFLNASANTFNGNQIVNGYQAVNGNLYVQNNATYQPLSVQSSSNFGTWLNLVNTSTGGKQWTILSAGGTNAEGAGNLGITNFTGKSNIYLEGNVKANTLSVNNDTPMSHNPHMSFSTTFVGSLCGGWVNCGFGTGSQWGAFVPDYNIVITRLTATLNSAIDPSCPADIAVSDTTAGQLLGSVSLTGGVKTFDSGPVSIPAPAGHFITVVPAVAGWLCNVGASAGGDVYINTQYVMQ